MEKETNKDWRNTPTGKLIEWGSSQRVCAYLDQGKIREAVAIQSRSCATYRGKKRQEKLRKMRRGKRDFRNFSARTFFVHVHRAFRELSHQKPN